MYQITSIENIFGQIVWYLINLCSSELNGVLSLWATVYTVLACSEPGYCLRLCLDARTAQYVLTHALSMSLGAWLQVVPEALHLSSLLLHLSQTLPFGLANSNHKLWCCHCVLVKNAFFSMLLLHFPITESQNR